MSKKHIVAYIVWDAGGTVKLTAIDGVQTEKQTRLEVSHVAFGFRQVVSNREIDTTVEAAKGRFKIQQDSKIEHAKAIIARALSNLAQSQELE